MTSQSSGQNSLSRRDFVKGTVAAAAASTALPHFTIAGTKSTGKVIGANDRIRHAVIGINGRGGSHISSFAGMDDVDITYLCDVDSRLFDRRTKSVTDRGGKAPQCVQDVRELLDDPNVDTISVATCNHWHALIGFWACQAGKHSYIEKPISHNVFEGRQLAKAAEKYGCVVQHGTQNRSSSGWARMIEAVHSEKYGKLVVSKGFCCKPRWSIGQKPISDPPEGLDFNLWLGPAPKQDFHGNLVHYNWHWFWDFGNGDVGNQGVHQMDVARWAIKDATLPSRIWSLGGRFGYEDQGETPNTLLSVYEYGDVILLFETRGLVGKHEKYGRIVTNVFYTSDGYIRDGRFYPKNGGKPESIQVEGKYKVAPGGSVRKFHQGCPFPQTGRQQRQCRGRSSFECALSSGEHFVSAGKSETVQRGSSNARSRKDSQKLRLGERKCGNGRR